MSNLVKTDKWLKEQYLLSGDGGNLIKERNNGIYYGVEAPPDLRDLFIDNIIGDDNNPGTQEKPFRSVGHALRKITDQPQSTIWLKQNQVFELDNFEYNLGNQMHLWIRTWVTDPNYQYKDIVNDGPEYAASYPRATLRFKLGIRNIGSHRVVDDQRIVCRRFGGIGVIFEFNIDSPPGSENLDGYIKRQLVTENEAYFAACILRETGSIKTNNPHNKYRQVDHFSVGNKLVLNSTRYELTDPDNQPFRLGYGDTLPNVHAWAHKSGTILGRGMRPDYPALFQNNEEYYRHLGLRFIRGLRIDKKLKMVQPTIFTWNVLDFI